MVEQRPTVPLIARERNRSLSTPIPAEVITDRDAPLSGVAVRISTAPKPDGLSAISARLASPVKPVVPGFDGSSSILHPGQLLARRANTELNSDP